ncbi:MAG: histidine phosphatase family protein [Bacteroidetes bacterium]|nr:histidine phosphatase family protein [Bacteroidota bacterium]
MKIIYLVRHAKSSWKFSNLSDFERPLNNRGRKAAPFMGKLLSKKGVDPDLIISSPAMRAITTAKLIAKKVDYPFSKILLKSQIYEAGVRQYYKVVQEVDKDVNELMLVGHNYSLTDFANTLCKTTVDNIPTAGVFAVRFKINKWKDLKEGIGVFDFFEYPKKNDR